MLNNKKNSETDEKNGTPSKNSFEKIISSLVQKAEFQSPKMDKGINLHNIHVTDAGTLGTKQKEVFQSPLQVTKKSSLELKEIQEIENSFKL